MYKIGRRNGNRNGELDDRIVLAALSEVRG